MKLALSSGSDSRLFASLGYGSRALDIRLQAF